VYEYNGYECVAPSNYTPQHYTYSWAYTYTILYPYNYDILYYHYYDKKKKNIIYLIEFIFNPSRESPLDVARKDYLEFFIEKILHHTGNITRLSTLNFKVKWQGYDDSYDSYEPWKNL
jgi:Chromo (CHRromatin Organisation MOdifier) domain